jgi:hypothetical protein
MTEESFANHLRTTERRLRDSKKRIEELEGKMEDMILHPRVVLEPASEVAKPSRFNGENREKFHEFITSCEMYIEANPGRFKKGINRILFVISYLEGQARTWITPFYRDYKKSQSTGDEPIETTDELFTSYESFKKKLEKMYGTVNDQQIAERKLDSCTQGTSDVSTYAAIFQQHAAHLPWDEAALGYRFYRGLNERIKDRLSEIGRPEMLPEVIDKAIEIDNRFQER